MQNLTNDKSLIYACRNNEFEKVYVVNKRLLR